MMLSIDQTLARAPELIDRYRPFAESIARSKRGVLHSEMFFFFCTVIDLVPGQIVESGRAQGQSTLLASLCFPDTRVVSVERDAEHPDAAIAQQRLTDRANVTCVFGDARIELPARVGRGDVVLIDGPKDFRALKLSARLFRHNKPAAIFLHDCMRGTAIRAYLERHLPWSFFADDERFQKAYGELDNEPPEKLAGLACIPANDGFPTFGSSLRLIAARAMQNLRHSGAQ